MNVTGRRINIHRWHCVFEVEKYRETLAKACTASHLLLISCN